MGHVDHGKTSLLDRIRGTSVASREPGQITQWIGASLIPPSTLRHTCGPLLDKFKLTIELPGLLFIDTPGHETFSNLRRRGGSAADVAILVVDLMKGFEPQTFESISILRSRKTPFIVAANKTDLVRGWKPGPPSLLENLETQQDEVRRELESKVYLLVGELSKLGFRSESFERISDFTRNIAIIPLSAKTGEGIPELLAVLVGLTQSFMKERLTVGESNAKGVVLEVMEEPGLGTTLNAIVYDGTLSVNDVIVLQGRESTISTKIRAILLPKPLDEIRDPRDKFTFASEVTAAAGIKIAASGLESALSGSPLYAVPEGESVDDYVNQVREEVESIVVRTDRTGIVVKADTLGSLEALSDFLSERQISVRLADIGDVSKRDVSEAAVVGLKDPSVGAILAFNVKVLPDAEAELQRTRVRLFTSDIVYHVLEEFLAWNQRQRAALLETELGRLIRPGKLRVLKGLVFRRSNPAIVGVEVLGGRIKPRYPLTNQKGKRAGQILKIQDSGKDITEATPPMQVAISIENAIVGRQIEEGDILYVNVPATHRLALANKYKDALDPSELSLIGELPTEPSQ